MLVTLIVVSCVAAFVLGAASAVLLRGARDRSVEETLTRGNTQHLYARQQAETRASEMAKRVDELEQEVESQRTEADRLQRERTAMEHVVHGAEAPTSEHAARPQQSPGATGSDHKALEEARAGLRRVLEQDKAKTEKLNRLRASAESAQALSKQAAKQAEAKANAAQRKLAEQTAAMAHLNEQLAEARKALEVARQPDASAESSRAGSQQSAIAE